MLVLLPLAGGATGTATSFDGSANITIPVTGLNASNINSGVVPVGYGGTGREDGAALDVYLWGLDKMATELGQVGNCQLLDGVDADTVTTVGHYRVINATADLHYPDAWITDGYLDVRVTHNRSGRLQILRGSYINNYGERIMCRSSVDSGATWTGWRPISTCSTGQVDIYISKNGSNTGMGTESDPFLTVEAARAFAQSVGASLNIIFHLGPGTWDYFYLYGHALSCAGVVITNWDDPTSSTPGASSMPVITEMYLQGCGCYVTVRNCKIGHARHLACAYVQYENYNKVAHFSGYAGSNIGIRGTCVFTSGDDNENLMYLGDENNWNIDANLVFESGSNTADSYFVAAGGDCSIRFSNTLSYSGTFSGTTLRCYGNTCLRVNYTANNRVEDLPGGGTTGGTNIFIDNGTPSHCIRNWRPGTNNAYSLGTGGARWTQVYATNGTISTSDERYKDEIAPIPDKVLDAWGNVSLSQFKFKDSIEAKGDDARLHTGLIAQDIQKQFTNNNLSAEDYGLFCYDEYEAEYEENYIVDEPEKKETVTVVDQKAIYENDELIQPEISHTEEIYVPEKGHNEKVLKRPAGTVYSVRYTEALIMECAYLRREIATLKNRLDKLEK